MLDHVPYLAVPLPEDIRRRKDAGYFSEFVIHRHFPLHSF